MAIAIKWNLSRALTAEEWGVVCIAARAAVDASEAEIRGGFGEAGTVPQIDAEMICLNGAEERDEHGETFLLRPGDTGYGFCKVAFLTKPFAAHAKVCEAILRAVGRVAPDALTMAENERTGSLI